MKKTQRGFDYTDFKDNNGVRCSIQKSSSAMEDKIWFGVNELNPQIMCSEAKKVGVPQLYENGWQPYHIPKEVLCNDRMHLTREMVQDILPILQKFVDTGEIN